LFHKLRQLDIPTLLIHGGRDIVPVECAAHIADALPRANFALLGNCGHFSYLECPDEVRKVISDFFHNT
jgi:proline iminopeptidase